MHSAEPAEFSSAEDTLLSGAEADTPAPKYPRTGEPAVATSRLANPRRILSWVYAGRIALAASIFAATVGVWSYAGPGITLIASLALVIAAVFTAGSFWYTHLSARTPGVDFLYAQSVFDAILVTAVVQLTGGQLSVFAPFYILVVCAASVLLPLAGGVLIGVLTSSLYLADIVLTSGTVPGTAALLQILLFTVVAVITSYLGDRLRQTGAALGEVQTELRLLRLNTDDILTGLSTGILTVDGRGNLAYLNAAAGELLGIAESDWLGKPILPLLEGVAPGLGSVIARSSETRKPIRRFETGTADHGTPKILGVSTTLMERDSAETPPVTAIFQDITERKRIDALRRRAERLEAIAELSASLAHEIKNPLASIRSAVEQLNADGIDPEDKSFLQRLVLRESDRLSRLLAEFIDFARVQVTAPQPIALRLLVRNVVALVRAHPDAAGRKIEVTLGSAGEDPLIQGDEDLLHRAVFNLVLNAVQWAGEGGQVQVLLDGFDSDVLSPSLGASAVVRLTVTDTGPGVPPELAEQIFDPFFTRRPGGTGLGLALVQRAADAHGGAIVVDESRAPEGGGCAFSLYLPALPAPASLPAETPSRKEIVA